MEKQEKFSEYYILKEKFERIRKKYKRTVKKVDIKGKYDIY